MTKLHEDIKRLSNDVTGEIDDISRYISIQYMKKKSNELKMKKSIMSNSMQSMVLPQFTQQQASQPAQQQASQENVPTVVPPAFRNLKNKESSKNEDFLNSDLFNSHGNIHNYGKIENSEKNFENLSKNNQKEGLFADESKGKNYQPL